MKDLSCVATQEQDDFFNSIDYILCDVDGVLWLGGDPIPGAREAIKSLKNQNKKVIFVSNNCTTSHENYYQQLKAAGYELEKNELVLPVLAMVDFLQKRHFSKEIFLIGMTPLRTHLQNAGFKVEDFNTDNPEEVMSKFIEQSVGISKNVGAVVADIDLNMKVVELQRAAVYLRNPEVFFITGGPDKRLTVKSGEVVIGPGCFHQILEDMSGRKATCLAKPSLQMSDFIQEKFDIKDPTKVLFIGDSIPEDMGFATKSGYKKLLVLSGLTREKSIESWEFPEEYKPDYYVGSLEKVQHIFKSKR